MAQTTYWNGEPTPCRKVTVRLPNTSEFPHFWGNDLLGTEQPAVLVEYADDMKYLLWDGDGSGWRKVTEGKGSPAWGHKEVPAESEIVKERA